MIQSKNGVLGSAFSESPTAGLLSTQVYKTSKAHLLRPCKSFDRIWKHICIRLQFAKAFDVFSSKQRLCSLHCWPNATRSEWRLAQTAWLRLACDFVRAFARLSPKCVSSSFRSELLSSVVTPWVFSKDVSFVFFFEAKSVIDLVVLAHAVHWSMLFLMWHRCR